MVLSANMPCCNIWEKFDVEHYLIKSYNHWILLVRKNHYKLGSCVAITKKHHETFSEISNEEMTEYALVMREAERAIKKAFSNDGIHHLALMLKDKHTHFHIVPRYKKPKEFSGELWYDDFDPDGILGTRDPALRQEVLIKIRDAIKMNI